MTKVTVAVMAEVVATSTREKKKVVYTHTHHTLILCTYTNKMDDHVFGVRLSCWLPITLNNAHKSLFLYFLFFFASFGFAAASSTAIRFVYSQS